MQTDSSAIATCLRFRSTVECTATVLMPSVWHARRMRSAISPRLAMTTLSSMVDVLCSGDHEQRLVELDRLTFLDLELGEVRFVEQVDELLDFAKVHGGPLVSWDRAPAGRCG